MRYFVETMNKFETLKIGVVCSVVFSFLISTLFFSLPAQSEANTPMLTPTLPPPPTTAPLYLPYIADTAAPDWLIYLNQIRSLAGLHPLDENPAWSEGAYFHSRYYVKENFAGNPHDEDPNSPWYTAAGQAAAQAGNVAWMFQSSGGPQIDTWAIDYWVPAPFHGISIVDPQLFSTGYGVYFEQDGTLLKSAGTLDVSRGLDTTSTSATFPVMFPRPGGSTWFLRFSGGEFPDPLPSCPGYAAPTGAAVFLQIGPGSETPTVTNHSLMLNGSILESCVFDETTYTHPDGGEQSVGRVILNVRDAIVLLPRKPLQVGQTYDVSITVNGVAYSWQFSTVPAPNLQPINEDDPLIQSSACGPLCN